MKTKTHILLISSLLLAVICYTQVFHKMVVKQGFSCVLFEDNGNAEEPLEKSSTEENSNETDQDEDPIRLVEILILSTGNSKLNSKIDNYSFGQFGYYPEIVSPPPQI